MSEGNGSDASSSKGSSERSDYRSDTDSARSAGSLNPDLVFPELVTIAQQFEEFHTVVSEQLHSLSERIEAFSTGVVNDRNRIVALEHQEAIHNRRLEDLVAQRDVDRAHIENLENAIKALKSEFEFMRLRPPASTAARTTALADLSASASSSRTLVESDVDHSDVDVTPKGKGKGKQRVFERSSKSASGRPSRSSVAKLKEGETESAARRSVQASSSAPLPFARPPTEASSRSSSPTIKPPKKQTVETERDEDVTPKKPAPVVKRERTMSWVETHGSGSDATSSTGTSGSHHRSQPTRESSSSRTDPFSVIANVTDEDEEAQISILTNALDLNPEHFTHTSASPEPNESGQEEPPPPSDSDSSSSSDEFQDADDTEDTEDTVLNDADYSEYHYAGVRKPPKASPVSIGPLRFEKMMRRLHFPPEVFTWLKETTASKEPQLHVFFCEDFAFLYNPFALEKQKYDSPPAAVTDPTSLITGWGSFAKMEETGPYIENHVPLEGQVYHTFALYKTKVCCVRTGLYNAYKLN
ncbi:hypothetical protein QCA50_000409 [Cerrena zonata]|uniref:Uncharacterized protein n=1 Tax=Cerrena zonata TaxID=2478898 RepID=A0AAW0GYZ8_9APHY